MSSWRNGIVRHERLPRDRERVEGFVRHDGPGRIGALVVLRMDGQTGGRGGAGDARDQGFEAGQRAARQSRLSTLNNRGRIVFPWLLPGGGDGPGSSGPGPSPSAMLRLPQAHAVAVAAAAVGHDGHGRLPGILGPARSVPQRRMDATAHGAVSWSLPTVTPPAWRFRSSRRSGVACSPRDGGSRTPAPARAGPRVATPGRRF